MTIKEFVRYKFKIIRHLKIIFKKAVTEDIPLEDSFAKLKIKYASRGIVLYLYFDKKDQSLLIYQMLYNPDPYRYTTHHIIGEVRVSGLSG